MSGLFVQLIVEQRDTCLTARWGQRESRLFYQTCHYTITKQCSASPVPDDKLHLIYSCVTCRPQTAVRHIGNEGLCQALLSVSHYYTADCCLKRVLLLFEGITTAAVCVYPSRVADAAKALKAANSSLPVASGTDDLQM